MKTEISKWQSPLEFTLSVLGDLPEENESDLVPAQPVRPGKLPEKKGPVAAETNPDKIAEYLKMYSPDLNAASIRYGVSRSLLVAVMIIESGGRPDAKSPTGCKGVMQLSHWIHGANQYGPAIDPYNPSQAIDRAGAFLGDLSKKYHGDFEKVVVGYNQGETVLNRAIRHAKAGGGRWQDHLAPSQAPEALRYIRVTQNILNGSDRRVSAAVRDYLV